MDLSIVIPTLNRAPSLKKTLQSISEQCNVYGNFEVIVVDNGSTDNTSEVCNRFRDQAFDFVYIYDEEPGQLTGRHKGTSIAKGQIISFLDDDVELNPNWVSNILKLFREETSISIIGGPSLPKYQAYPPKWVGYFWQDTPYGGSMCLPLSLIDIGVDRMQVDPLYVFGLNYSIRKPLLLELGGFHPDCIPGHLQQYQGDGETGLSLKAKGRNIKALYAAAAMVYHQVPASRLQQAYFENWYYYSGVCQSFTDIRLRNNLYPGNQAKAPVDTGFLKKVLHQTSNMINRVFKKDDGPLPPDIKVLQESFSIHYHKGYHFHQEAFKNDSKVRDWVLKNDYWNYQIPVNY